MMIPSKFLMVFGLALMLATSAKGSGKAPRERIPFNDGWRFKKDDPSDSNGSLRYDVRPEVKMGPENQVADAKPQEAEARPISDIATLKPWILPTGNAFIADPARRYQRPAGDPGHDVSYVKATFDDHAWQAVNLPHDWAIEGPFLPQGDFGGMGRLPSWGIGWYRKAFHVPSTDVGKRIELEIDGAMSYAMVWLNGHLVGGWPYGYASWRVDLTPYLVYGNKNQLAIRLDNPPASSRWYPGGGIYRNVWLTKTQAIHLAPWGTSVRTPAVSADSATVALDMCIANDGKRDTAVRLMAEIFSVDDEGRKRHSVAHFSGPETPVPANGTAQVTGSVMIKNPQLWGPPPHQRPNRYIAVITLRRDGMVIDQDETLFGIRSIRFDPVTGIHINGERVQIQGVNNHHDLGALGTAFNVRAAERQLELLREMGCNAIRMSHNPPAPELLELTDRMGFLVLDEIFDGWEQKKTPLDFHLIFPEWHEPDLRAFIRRDRNHPSVLIWSIGNEVGEQHTGSAGALIAKRLCEIVHEEDPTRPTTAAMNFAKPEMPLPMVIDLIGLNYQGEGIRQDPEFEGTDRIRTPPQYEAFHSKFPDKVILSTETASAFSTRGEYLFPVSTAVSAPVRDGRGGDSNKHVVSAYELHAVDFGSTADKVFSAIEHHPFVAGEFVWTGWDHLGEPTPYYTSRTSYCGIIDMAGFKKDRFYLYQSRWRPDLPMAHILPHWTWPERVGLVTPVHVFTSGDEAELFLNGRSLGRKKKHPFEYRLRWDDVVYQPGTLQVVAYKNERPWATDRVQTAEAASVLQAEPDRTRIHADGRDLAFVTVRVLDAKGVFAPRAMNPLSFSIEGPGEFVAADNGDPTSFEPFRTPARKAFNGLCMIMVRAKPGQAGPITITITGEGLKSAKTRVYAGSPQ